MTSRNRWVRTVLGVLALAALLMTGLAQAQIINPATELQVMLEPAGAVAAGAQWKLDSETDFHDSGATISDLTTGTHTEIIQFKPIGGWVAPADFGMLVQDGVLNITTGTYTLGPVVGSLQVFIAPNGLPGAEWRRMATTAFNSSGFIENGLTAGLVQVEFSPVPGWIPPANQDVTILASQLVITTGTYTPAPPTSLQVFIEPQGAIDAGAQWRRVGTTTYFNSGFIEDNLTTGPAVVEFSTIDGWITPQPQDLTLPLGLATVTTGIYVLAPSVTSLRVTLEPTSVTLLGAQWRYVSATTTTLFLGSNVTVTGLTAESGTIEFSAVAGWVTPTFQPVTILAGQPVFATGFYTPALPAATELQVFIEPGLALAAGAQWRRVGTTPYFGPGFVESGLTSGPASVEFKPIPGWITPANEAVVIVTDQRVVTSGTYVALPAATRLQVFIEPTPTSVTLVGAQWRLVSATTTTLFLNSGATAAGLTSGSAVVEFSAVTGWIAPANQNVTILTQQLVVTTGTYTLAPPVVTALQVFIEPAAAVAAGALWRIQGETNYNPSGFVRTGLTAGPAVVEFNGIVDWVAPPNQNVTIVADQTVVTTGTFVAAGGLQITITPPEAVTAGAQWRRVGTTAYLSSGAIESVPVGTYAVEFKPTPGWTAPANLTGLVVLTGLTTYGNGIYTIIPSGPTNYKVSYKGCTIVKDPGNRGLTVTNANAAIIKIQKLKKLPKNHNDVTGKVLFLLNSPGIDFLNATGTIKTLTGIGAFIGTIHADVSNSIKMGVVDTAVAAPATSIFATSATLPTAKTLKVSLTGVSLKNLVTNPSSAAAVAIRISAKKIKGATVPAGVTAGAQILVGNGLSLGVIGGNIYADLIESTGGIKSLTAKSLGQLMGGNLGQAPTTSATLAATLETLGDFLTPAALAVVQHPSTPVVVSGLHNGPSLATDGIGKIFASTVHGVFVVGADLVGGLIEPRCDAAVKKWKATNASGDAFVSAPAKTQPAGIAAHTTAP